MATKKGSSLSGKLGEKIHYNVNGTERVRTSPEHVNQPGTDIQRAHWGAFTDIVRLSSQMSAAHKIGLAYPARRNHTYPYLHFRSINKDCFTPDGAIDYPRVIISYGTVAPVVVTSVEIQAPDKSDRQTVTIHFDPCLSCSNSNPDDELYLFAYCPACLAGILTEPVPRIAGSHTVTLPSEWPSVAPEHPTGHAAGIHLYAFLRCPGPTDATPTEARSSAKNRRGQTSITIYIPL
jgi:hypothetical protein